MKRNRGWPARCAMLSVDPVRRLSIATTEYPSSISRSQRWLPRKPAPPVTRTRCMRTPFEAGDCSVRRRERSGHAVAGRAVAEVPRKLGRPLERRGREVELDPALPRAADVVERMAGAERRQEHPSPPVRGNRRRRLGGHGLREQLAHVQEREAGGAERAPFAQPLRDDAPREPGLADARE